MSSNNKNLGKVFGKGFIVGVALVFLLLGLFVIKKKHPGMLSSIKKTVLELRQFPVFFKKQITEKFDQRHNAVSGESFGHLNQLTFELFRNGTFFMDGSSGYAVQKSDSYRDSAFIRSTTALPKTYKISIILGEIDYGLEKIRDIPNDPEYPEGPKNENGVYLIAITDEKPTGHHTNIWWHQHRKLVIDVDNNVWGYGMPNPVFMVYFDRLNQLVSYDGPNETWQREWKKAITYSPSAWYKIEIEKTKNKYVMSIYDSKNTLLRRGSVNIDDVWHSDEIHPEYFVVGDPHENYYQGSMKIQSIAVTPNY